MGQGCRISRRAVVYGFFRSVRLPFVARACEVTTIHAHLPADVDSSYIYKVLQVSNSTSSERKIFSDNPLVRVLASICAKRGEKGLNKTRLRAPSFEGPPACLLPCTWQGNKQPAERLNAAAFGITSRGRFSGGDAMRACLDNDEVVVVGV